MKPKVSIIIPNYNYANYVCEAIDSALNQTYENVEVIVVDDGSKDDSPNILKTYGDKIKAIFQKNSGVSRARNNGVENSDGEYVAFLDADDIWLPEKIEKQVKLFEKQNNLGLVHVGVADFNEDGIIENKLNGLEGNVSHEFLLFERSVILGGGSGLIVPREVFDEVGGFDLELLTSADWDLFYRISRRYEIGFVSEVLLKYRMHGSNMHGNIKRMEKEMLHAYQKAFTEDAGDIKKIKNKAYSNLHKVLAGSYFHTGDYKNFLNQAFKSLTRYPKNISHFASFPVRALRRKIK